MKKSTLWMVAAGVVACWCETVLTLPAQAADNAGWQSFELVYYDPSASPHAVKSFNVGPSSAFSTEMRMDYLKRYASALEQRAGASAPEFLAFDVVTTDAARQRAARIKERPQPQIRHVVQLKYWRWKLEPDFPLFRDPSWETRAFKGESTWNAMEAPGMFAFNHSAWLRTHFRGPEGKRTLLAIGSIVDVYEIWVNGRFVGRHSGFEPVTLDITGFTEEDHDNTLALRIENKPGDQIGIADDISVIGVSNPHLSDVFLKTDRAQDQQADATLEVEALGGNSRPAALSVKIQITPWFPDEGATPVFQRVMPIRFAKDGTGKLRVPVHLAQVSLWSPDAPHLYEVKVILQDATGRPSDELVEVTGFRQIEQRQGRLFLNGRPWFMKSFGEALGFAPGFSTTGDICPPDEWILRDFMLAQRAHANTIRIHPWGFSEAGKYTDSAWPYPGVHNSSTNYQRIAWIADQLGIALVWGTRLWTIWPESFQDTYAVDDHWEKQLEPSLRHVRNRPSILIYEGLNEVGTSLAFFKDKTQGTLEEQYERFCRRYLELVNQIDDSRLVIPDTNWGGLVLQSTEGGPYVAERAGPFHPLSLYTAISNTFWTAHTYYGWYVNLPSQPLLENAPPRPFILMEAGAEAMPDWRLYRGLRWSGIWLNNDSPAGVNEEARLGRPLRILEDSEADLSQANQGLSIVQTVFATRFSSAAGININLIADGLSEGTYHKGVSDIYRQAKLGFFAAQMAYQPLSIAGAGFDFLLGSGDALHLQVAADSALWGRSETLTAEVVDATGAVRDTKSIPITLATDQRVSSAGDYVPHFGEKGFYLLRYTLTGRQVQ